MMGWLRMITRLILVLFWTLALLPIQLVLINRAGEAKERLPMTYWSGVARLLGLKLAVTGTIAHDPARPNRPILFVANHTSWVDIIALGAVLPGCFIAKGDVAKWPGISLIARAGRTIFVSRARGNTGRERTALESRLDEGDNLILFPEGTTSDGARTLQFRSSFLALADRDIAPLIQPVTIVYDQLDGLPICRRNRPLIAWYGDMDIASHYARLGRHSLRARIILSPPLPASLGRKTLATPLESTIASRAAALGQQRFIETASQAAPPTPEKA